MRNFLPLFFLGYRNVGRRKKRSFLTMLGIIVGIASVVALISLGGGLQNTIIEQFERVGADKIIIQAKEFGSGSGEGIADRLKKSEVDVLKRVRGVEESAGLLFQGAKVVINDIQRVQYVISIPDNFREKNLVDEFATLESYYGRLLSYKDRQKSNIGYNIALGGLFGRSVSVGNKILVNDEIFEVVGILKRTGDPAMDSAVILSEFDARRVLAEPDAYSQIVVKSSSGESAEIVADRIKKELRRFRNLGIGEENFRVQTSNELIETFNNILLIIQSVFIGIAAISLLVGAVGIMNTMYTAVLERTQEIGVMKSIGAMNVDIAIIFLSESGLLGFTGGAVGIFVGIAISKFVEFVVNTQFGPLLSIKMSLPLIFGTILFSTIVGTLSGALPSWHASKQKPVESLRYE